MGEKGSGVFSALTYRKRWDPGKDSRPLFSRYVELNPVRARLVRSAGEYAWSSARPHLKGKDDILVRVKPLLELAPDWKGLLRTELGDEALAELRRHERTGRPLGNDGFVRRLERRLGRLLRRQKPGPKPETGIRKDH